MYHNLTTTTKVAVYKAICISILLYYIETYSWQKNGDLHGDELDSYKSTSHTQTTVTVRVKG